MHRNMVSGMRWCLVIAILALFAGCGRFKVQRDFGLLDPSIAVVTDSQSYVEKVQADGSVALVPEIVGVFSTSSVMGQAAGSGIVAGMFQAVGGDVTQETGDLTVTGSDSPPNVIIHPVEPPDCGPPFGRGPK